MDTNTTLEEWKFRLTPEERSSWFEGKYIRRCPMKSIVRFCPSQNLKEARYRLCLWLHICDILSV